MKKSILICLVLITIFASTVFAEVLVSPIGDPQIKVVEFENGQKLKYFETRVLISPQRHASGMPDKKVKKEVEKICICKCIKEDTIKVTSWLKYDN